MPPPLDLTGRRFGRLVVQSAGPMVQWGKQQRGWHCRCDCGALLIVPQNRLPHRKSIPHGHIVDACDDCRSRPCTECGAPVPKSSQRKQCSDACHREHKRRYHLQRYHDLMQTDADFRARNTARSSRRYRDLSDADRHAINKTKYTRELAELGRDGLRKRDRDAYHARMQDPAARNRHRQKNDAWIAANPEKWAVMQRNAARRKRRRDAERQIGDIISKQDENDD